MFGNASTTTPTCTASSREGSAPPIRKGLRRGEYVMENIMNRDAT